MVLRVNITTVNLHAPIFHAILHTRIPLRYMSPTQTSLPTYLPTHLSISISLSCAGRRFVCAVSVLTGLRQRRSPFRNAFLSPMAAKHHTDAEHGVTTAMECLTSNCPHTFLFAKCRSSYRGDFQECWGVLQMARQPKRSYMGVETAACTLLIESRPEDGETR